MPTAAFEDLTGEEKALNSDDPRVELAITDPVAGSAHRRHGLSKLVVAFAKACLFDLCVMDGIQSPQISRGLDGRE